MFMKAFYPLFVVSLYRFVLPFIYSTNYRLMQDLVKNRVYLLIKNGREKGGINSSIALYLN